MVVGFFGFFRRHHRERELDEEIRSHIKMAVAERVARGESREEAERAAWREFGNEARVREVTRTMWGSMWLDRLTQDLRYGVRSLLRDRGFALAAVVILTVGIGANTIVFTLAHGALFDAPPAVAQPSNLVGVAWTESDDGEQVWSYTDYEFVRERATALAGVSAYVPGLLPVAVESAEGGGQANVWVVSDNYFDVLGTPMAFGRAFLPEEGRTLGTHPVAILSRGFWERHYGADPSVLGSTVRLNGTAFTVVGVTPREFRGTSPIETPPDVYVPLMMQGTIVAGAEEWFRRVDGERSTWLRVMGRLPDGFSLAAAQSNMEALNAAWDAEYGAWAQATDVPAFRFSVTPDYRFQAGEGERIRRMLGFLVIVAAAVLLIACANLALLLLARAPTRRGEMGVRVALGAGRSRIVRQLLTEGALLAAVGGLGGWMVSLWGASAVAALMPYSIAADFTPDGTVLAYVGAVTLGVTVVFALAPALSASGVDIAGVLRGARRTSSRGGARSVLVVAQVAASVVLVAGAALFVRSLAAARSVDLGFEPERRLLTSVALPNHGYDEPGGRAFIATVLERIRAVPGVEAVSTTSRAPFGGQWASGIRPEGAPEGGREILYFNYAGPEYFDVMGIPVADGRAIDERDVQGAQPALMINETTAERLWPEQDAVGRTIEWRDRIWTVVGVAADAKYYAIGEPAASQVYVPPAQEYDGRVTFVIRTATDPADLAPAVQAAIQDVDAAVAVFGVETLQDRVNGQTSTYRALALLVSVFGAIALVLAAVGLYGVLAYLVSQSSREIGIRMALGARSRDVASGVLRRGSLLAALGVAIGLGLAWFLAGLVRQMLFGVEPQDPLTLSVAVAILMGVALLASYLPARRAARVQPAVTLRDA